MNNAPPTISARRILTATALALAVALVVLVTAVLPAEYGIDPLGTGKALGLIALAEAEPDDSISVDVDPTQLAAIPDQTGQLARDTFTVELRPYEGVEYKYRLEQGNSLVYAWSASSPVAFDFHGEPDGAPERYSESYGNGDGDKGQGVFVAPKPGIHGWFWENPGAGRITITLTTSGFYTASTEYRDGERHQRVFGEPGT